MLPLTSFPDFNSVLSFLQLLNCDNKKVTKDFRNFFQDDYLAILSYLFDASNCGVKDLTTCRRVSLSGSGIICFTVNQTNVSGSMMVLKKFIIKKGNENTKNGGL